MKLVIAALMLTVFCVSCEDTSDNDTVVVPSVTAAPTVSAEQEPSTDVVMSAESSVAIPLCDINSEMDMLSEDADNIMVTVPDLVGMSSEDASRLIKTLAEPTGIRVCQKLQYSETIPDGVIISQSAQGAHQVNNTVRIVVSAGRSPTVAVPNDEQVETVNMLSDTQLEFNSTAECLKDWIEEGRTPEESQEFHSAIDYYMTVVPTLSDTDQIEHTLTADEREEAMRNIAICSVIDAWQTATDEDDEVTKCLIKKTDYVADLAIPALKTRSFGDSEIDFRGLYI